MKDKSVENKTVEIESTDEAWDEKLLGADEAYAVVAEGVNFKEIHEAAGTQLISIRMQKTMIEDLKAICAINNGIGYQTLMKQVLQRFIDGEKKQLWNSMVSEKLKEQQSQAESETRPKAKVSRAA